MEYTVFENVALVHAVKYYYDAPYRTEYRSEYLQRIIDYVVAQKIALSAEDQYAILIHRLIHSKLHSPVWNAATSHKIAAELIASLNKTLPFGTEGKVICLCTTLPCITPAKRLREIVRNATK